MKTEDFLDILEQRRLISQRVVDQIRAKLEEGNRLTAKSLLKYLVKKELISRSHAKQLLETTLTVGAKAESSILGIVPLPEVPAEIELQPDQSIVADEPEGSSLSVVPLDKESLEPIAPTHEEPTLDPLLADAEADNAAVLGSGKAKPKKKKKKRRGKKGRKESEWDSPLLLVGGGGLVALLIAGISIWYLLGRENADQILEEASAFFDGGSYTQAIKQYERFVERFPDHPQFSDGRVRLGMARLWKATEGTSNFQGALATAQQVIEEIEDEKEFASAQEDLASLLPKIATGLAEQAEQGKDLELVKQRVEQATAALSLCANTKYIPKTFRNEPVLEEVKATLARVERRRQQNADLQQSLQEIDQAISSLDIAEAYTIHKGLLKRHPGLLNNEILAAKVLEISQTEKSVVKFVPDRRPAETTARLSQVVASLTLADRRGPAAPQGQRAPEQKTVAVSVDGAVYGLNANDGSVLWRQFVGLQSLAAPVALDGGDWLIVDARRHELSRLDGGTGKLKWRQPLGAALARPVVAGEQILVAAASGKLFVLDEKSGELAGYVQFGQPLRVPPAVDRSGKRIFVVGEHSSFYTLDADDLSCLGVFYLGHAKGTIAVAPVAMLNKVAVVENTGVATSRLRLLGTDKTGTIASQVASSRLHGLASTPLLVEGRRLVTLTSSGEVAVFEIGSGDDRTALTLLAKRKSQGNEPVARFGVIDRGHVWVGGTQLSKLAILPTGNRLPVRDVDHNFAGAVFDHPLQLAGGLVVHVRRPVNQAGAIVGAMESATGKSFWETHLAVPPAGPPIVDVRGPRITTATATGAVYELDRQAMGRRVQDQSQRLGGSPLISPPLAASVELGKGRLAFAAERDSKQLLLYERGALRNPLRLVRLDSETSCSPVAWRGGLVVPTRVGQVLFLDAASGQATHAPFQPPLEPGNDYRWLPPAVAGANESALLAISDGVQKIYLLDIQATPQPYLLAVAEAPVGPSPLVSRLAVVGNVVFAGTADGKLARFRLPKLEAEEGTPLGAPVVWGPFAVGGRLLMATANDELICIDAGDETPWRRPLEHGSPIGRPLAVGGDLLLLWQNNSLTRMHLADGEETGKLQLAEPVVAGPVPFGRRLVLSAHDGTLLVVESP